MELEQEFKDFIKEKLFHPSKAITNPSAFTSIYYIKGYGGARHGVIRSLIEKEIQRLKS